MVQEEPVRERDLVAMGMLLSIGIEKGKEFNPDAATQSILKSAAQEQLAGFVEGMKTFGARWWSDRAWALPDTRGVKTNFSYETDVALDVDARGLSNFAAFGFPKRVGQGGSIVYLVAFRDGRNEPISGENSYKLHVPANVPARAPRTRRRPRIRWSIRHVASAPPTAPSGAHQVPPARAPASR